MKEAVRNIHVIRVPLGEEEKGYTVKKFVTNVFI